MNMEITEELIEQTWNFCYKRLGNPDDARDLAQDILCEAVQAIASGREIIHFQACSGKWQGIMFTSIICAAKQYDRKNAERGIRMGRFMEICNILWNI